MQCSRCHSSQCAVATIRYDLFKPAICINCITIDLRKLDKLRELTKQHVTFQEENGMDFEDYMRQYNELYDLINK